MNGCSCAYESECNDCEPAAVWEETRIAKTRIPHRCYECHDEIPAGSRCCKVAALRDGRWWTGYRCISCSTYAEYISMAAKLCPLWGHLSGFVEDNELQHEGLPTLREWRLKDG